MTWYDLLMQCQQQYGRWSGGWEDAKVCWYGGDAACGQSLVGRPDWSDGDQEKELEGLGGCGRQGWGPEEAGWERAALQPVQEEREELHSGEVQPRQAGLDLCV